MSSHSASSIVLHVNWNSYVCAYLAGLHACLICLATALAEQMMLADWSPGHFTSCRKLSAFIHLQFICVRSFSLFDVVALPSRQTIKERELLFDNVNCMSDACPLTRCMRKRGSFLAYLCSRKLVDLLKMAAYRSAALGARLQYGTSNFMTEFLNSASLASCSI